MFNPHFVVYTAGSYSVNENNKPVYGGNADYPFTTEKMVVNHYQVKSLEEYMIKLQRGAADGNSYEYKDSKFELYDKNDEFDDGILHYRDERMKVYQPPDNSHATDRLLNALLKNLSPTLLADTPADFYKGKLETFLTCHAVASYLQTKLTDDATAKFFAEVALKAILKSLDKMSLGEAQMFTLALPKILEIPYPIVKDIRALFIKQLPGFISQMRLNHWHRDVMELDYLQDLLKLI